MTFHSKASDSGLRKFFRINFYLNAGRVSRPGDGVGIDQFIQLAHGSGIQRYLQCAKVFHHIVSVLGAGNGDNVVIFLQLTRPAKAGQGYSQRRPLFFRTGHTAPYSWHSFRALNRGMFKRKSPCSSCAAGSVSLPVRKPRASGLKATKVIPSSLQASSTAISALRLHREYSV